MSSTCVVFVKLPLLRSRRHAYTFLSCPLPSPVILPSAVIPNEVKNLASRLHGHDAGGVRQRIECGHFFPSPQPSPSRGEGALTRRHSTIFFHFGNNCQKSASAHEMRRYSCTHARVASAQPDVIPAHVGMLHTPARGVGTCCHFGHYAWNDREVLGCRGSRSHSHTGAGLIHARAFSAVSCYNLRHETLRVLRTTESR